MTTFLEFKDLVYKSIARDSSDALAAVVVPKAVNYAINAAAALFKPPELSTSSDLTLTAGNNYVQITQDFIDLIRVNNYTDGIEMKFIPYELFYALKPTIDDIKYFTLFGKFIYVNTTSLADKTITIYYITYPTELSADEDVLEFTKHDPFIIAMAAAMAFATLEEGESVDIWAKVTEAFGATILRPAQAREIISGGITSLEATVTGALAGSQK